ncbi:MAG: ABC transporter substrate-binding protein [Chloroflexota bacterium]
MKVKVSVRIICGILSLLLALSAVTACAPAAQSPVAGAVKVKVGLSLGLTGSLASTVAPISQGALAYMKWVNDQGGIEYRDPKTGKTEKALLDIAWEDNAYSAAKTLSIYKRQKDWGMLLQVLVMSPDVIADTASRSQVPIMSVGNITETSIKPEPRYITVLYGSYLDQMLTFVKWTSQQQATPPKVGFILMDLPTHRASGGGGGLSAELVKEFGGELVGVEWVPAGVTDSSIEMTRLKAGNPDWIYIANVTSGVSTIAKDAQRLGITPKTRLATITYVFGEDLIPVLGDLSEGLYGALCWSYPSEATIPGIKLAHDAMQKYYARKASATNVQGVLTSMVAVEGIRQALGKVGAEALTPSAVNDALHSLTNFDPMGLTKPITTTTAYPVSSGYVKVGTIKGGVVQPVSDWIEVSKAMLRFVK